MEPGLQDFGQGQGFRTGFEGLESRSMLFGVSGLLLLLLEQPNLVF